MAKIKAILGATQISNAKHPKQPLDSYMLLIAKDGNKLIEAVTVRWYMSPRGSVVRCCIWVHTHTKGYYVSGSGSAGGGGYCKMSASLDSAISSAGVELDTSIHGVGMGACREALEAIGRAIGYKTMLVVEG